MHILRRTFVVIMAALLPALLLLTAFDFGLLSSVGQPAQVKKTLADSGIYKDVIPSILAQSKSISSPIGSIPLSDPIIQSAAKNAFNPSYIEQQTNGAINDIYSWLEGNTTQPNISINLSSQKQQFASLAANTAKQEAAALPTCTQLSDISTFNILSATCLPPGVSPDAVASATKDTLLNGQGFLDNASISASDIKTAGSNQSVFTDQLKHAPSLYQNLKKLPWVTAVLSLLCAAGIVLLSLDRRRGLRRVGIILITSGILMLIFTGIFSWVINSQLIAHLNLSNQALQADIKAVLKDIVQNTDSNYRLFGSIYMILGIIATALAIWLLKSQKPLPAETEPETSQPKAAK